MSDSDGYPDFGRQVVFTRYDGTVLSVNGRAPDGGVETGPRFNRSRSLPPDDAFMREMVAFLRETQEWLAQRRREQHPATRGGWD